VRGRFPIRTYVKAGTLGLAAPPDDINGELLTRGTTTQCPSGLTAFYTETLDSSGRVRHQSQPYDAGQPAYWSTHSYDELGRLTQSVDPKGGVTTTTYAELLTTVTNPAGQQRREERNHLGEVVRVRDHNALGTRTTGAYIDYAYDATGNLITTQLKTDGSNLATGVPAAITTTIGYDTWGRKTSLADPDKGTWSYQYNAFDELIVQQDAKGQKSLLGYDALGRLVSREDRRGDGSTESTTDFAYDKHSSTGTTVRGRLMDAVHTLFAANGTTQTGEVLRVFSYDGFKRPARTDHTLDGGPTWSETQTYDAFGRVFQRLDASGADRGVQYVYNANGYLQQTLESAKSGGSNLAYSTISARNAYGSVTQETLGNGYVTTRSFEAERGLTLAIRTADAANLSDTQDLTLVWDLVGNLLSRRDLGAARDTTESHTYDALNRLRITSLDGTQTDSTTYDAFGNIKSKTGIGTYSYLSARPHAVSATSSGSKTWSYDANGNMDGGDGRTITYTTHDKPELITKGTTSAAFRYGPGREYYKRVDTVAGVTTTTWFVGATEIVDKSDGTRDIRRSVDGVVEQVLHFNAGGTLTGTDTRYLLRDHLGSITGFMNGTAIDQEQAFDAWGRRENVGWASYMTVGGSTWNAIMALTERGFTGHQHVDRLDFIHMNGRTYDPKLGRFMQADIVVQAPANTQSYNRYSYLMNNPLNGTDPSGYFGTKDLVGTAVYVVASYFVTPAVAGALAGGAQSAAYGGDAAAIVTGAAWGALSSAAFSSLNGSQAFGWGSTGQYGQHAFNVAANGVLGGAISVTQGGKFGHGFASAGVSAFGNGLMNNPGAYQVKSSQMRVVISAVIGGTASELSGGKFANGAATVAFAAIVSSAAQRVNGAGEQGNTKSEYYEADNDAVKGYSEQVLDELAEQGLDTSIYNTDQVTKWATGRPCGGDICNIRTFDSLKVAQADMRGGRGMLNAYYDGKGVTMYKGAFSRSITSIQVDIGWVQVKYSGYIAGLWTAGHEYGHHLDYGELRANAYGRRVVGY
jgi:RHS repeat-associated protein